MDMSVSHQDRMTPPRKVIPDTAKQVVLFTRFRKADEEKVS